jgi:hypothetical protein
MIDHWFYQNPVLSETAPPTAIGRGGVQRRESCARCLCDSPPSKVALPPKTESFTFSKWVRQYQEAVYDRAIANSSITMSAVIVLGAQWGDEGKGKIVDVLCEGIQLCCRAQGGFDTHFP